MLVRYYLELSHPAHAVQSVLSHQPQVWLPEIVRACNRRGMETVLRVGLNIGRHRIDRAITPDITGAHQLGDTCVTPIAWAPKAEHSMLPSLEGSLEVAPLGEDRAQLAISASYRPPLSWLGAVADRALLRRVAEATIKDFLDRVAFGVEAQLREARHIGPPAGARLAA